MERTPKSRAKRCLPINKTEDKTRPYHSTPETSTSQQVRRNISSGDISPVDTPDWNECLSQRVYWGWKSPEVGLRRGVNVRTDSTPKANCKYLSPKPKRKLIRHNYADNLSKWAEEFKSLQEELKTVKEKPLRSKTELKGRETQEEPPEKISAGEISANQKADVEEHCVKADVQSLPEKLPETVSQDILVVEVTQGLTSSKSFPPNHQFPKVPKLDFECDMNKSDYVILMEDHSIEDEMIRCTQQIEEQILGQKSAAQSEKNKAPVSVSENDSKVINAINKFTDYVTSPKCVSSPLRTIRSPTISNKISSGRKCMPSPKNGPNSKVECGVVSWDCETMDTKMSEAKEKEEVLCMLEDDSFDNIMLEMVVEGEKSASPPEVSKSEANKCVSVGLERIPKNGEKALRNGDSFGMLEDDSIIQPDVLNFLDVVEGQAVAASQPIKCTPEEIQKKMIEAKKKLAVGKRKRKSQMARSLTNPKTILSEKGLVNS